MRFDIKQPEWTIDETLLAVDTYFQIGDVRKITDTNPFIIELSNILQELPIHKEKDEIFRNFIGVELTLKSIAALDKKAKYSMRAASKMQERVFNYYNNKKELLRVIVKSIKNCLPLIFNYDKKINTPFYLMGNILFQQHKYLENSQVAKSLYIDSIQRMKSICNYCGIDLYKKYGVNGFEMVEFHFFENLTNYYRNMEPLQSKFTQLCPNCHKFSHLYLENFTIGEYDSIKNS